MPRKSLVQPRQSPTKNRKNNRLKESPNVHKPQSVILCAKDIVTDAAAGCGVDEVYFGGGNFGDDTHVTHDAATHTMSFEADNISGSGVGDGHMYASIVEQRGTCGCANAEGGVIAITHKTTAVESRRGFPSTAVMCAQVFACFL